MKYICVLNPVSVTNASGLNHVKPNLEPNSVVAVMNYSFNFA